jgi:hypothetical protein
MDTEIIYLGHDNRVDLILKADGVAVDLAPVTRMTLSVGTTLIDSDNGASDAIRWAQSGYATGEVRISAGAVTGLTAGKYRSPLVVYDPTNTDGVVWGYVPMMVVADPEATVTP